MTNATWCVLVISSRDDEKALGKIPTSSVKRISRCTFTVKKMDEGFQIIPYEILNE